MRALWDLHEFVSDSDERPQFRCRVILSQVDARLDAISPESGEIVATLYFPMTTFTPRGAVVRGCKNLDPYETTRWLLKNPSSS